MNIIIFDLDGTLALIEHRRHFVENGNKDWDGFFAACVDDEPNQAIIDVYNLLWAGRLDQIHIWSGRSDKVRHETVKWLIKHGLHPPVSLRMRKDGDYTRDETLKKQWLDETRAAGHKIEMVFDDRRRVVDMWRAEGITCLQVAPGDF